MQEILQLQILHPVNTPPVQSFVITPNKLQYNSAKQILWNPARNSCKLLRSQTIITLQNRKSIHNKSFTSNFSLDKVDFWIDIIIFVTLSKDYFGHDNSSIHFIKLRRSSCAQDSCKHLPILSSIEKPMTVRSKPISQPVLWHKTIISRTCKYRKSQPWSQLTIMLWAHQK